MYHVLAKLGMSVNNTMALSEAYRGLSFNDSYWVVRKDFEKNFDLCNLYEHKFSEVLASIAFIGYGSSVFLSGVEA